MTDYRQIKQQLVERKVELEKIIKQEFGDETHQALSDLTGELSQYDNHPADAATDLYEREKDYALLEHAEREHEEVEHALQKFADGTYGICEATGQTIPLERLEANPTARTIVTAATQENRGRPAEEDVVKGFSAYQFDGRDDETEFDAEDAYQSVARFNDNAMTYEDASLDEEDESIGYVEEIEGFLSTGIEGYTGSDKVDVQHNVHLNHYVNGDK
ncbi:TraR/DksA C4-type zinc finger protein [Alkalihalobacillus oceani]|uniref:TraR/DksA C4-type zinc finger protein n=1 Tax=Halalkalibacter oceani TaxID=1653776 RepID=UPI002041BAA7|nr:TraR/DksA C4-type zinc finger protein [Halalkalibacter oceani]